MSDARLQSSARRRCLRALLAAGAGGIASAAGARMPAGGDGGFHAIPLAEDSHGLGFNLTDLDGRPRTATSFPGSVLVLFFGFLSCPSICPSTIFELQAARQALGGQARRVRIAFATLDPERDSATAMRNWLRHFGDDLVGLRDTPAAIARATRTLRLDWARVPGQGAARYTIDHGVQAYVFDPRGRLRLLMRPGPTAQEVASDWRRLLNGA
jgi:protein SCO1